jgi:hypothetical protein
MLRARRTYSAGEHCGVTKLLGQRLASNASKGKYLLLGGMQGDLITCRSPPGDD